MKVIDNDLIVFCDVDDTLLMQLQDKFWEPIENSIRIEHPLNKDIYYLVPHRAHINLLKSYKAQGYTVFVWSAQGKEWAKLAVQVLELEDTVDWVMSKPLKYVDDLKGPEGILGSRVYIPFEQVNKVIEPGESE